MKARLFVIYDYKYLSKTVEILTLLVSSAPLSTFNLFFFRIHMSQRLCRREGQS